MYCRPILLVKALKLEEVYSSVILISTTHQVNAAVRETHPNDMRAGDLHDNAPIIPVRRGHEQCSLVAVCIPIPSHNRVYLILIDFDPMNNGSFISPHGSILSSVKNIYMAIFSFTSGRYITDSSENKQVVEFCDPPILIVRRIGPSRYNIAAEVRKDRITIPRPGTSCTSHVDIGSIGIHPRHGLISITDYLRPIIPIEVSLYYSTNSRSISHPIGI